jgi:hypothetical protein
MLGNFNFRYMITIRYKQHKLCGKLPQNQSVIDYCLGLCPIMESAVLAINGGCIEVQSKEGRETIMVVAVGNSFALSVTAKSFIKDPMGD